MSKFISRLFGPSTSTATAPHITIPDVENLTPETVLQEAKLNALSDFLDPSCKDVIARAMSKENVALPSLLYVHIGEDMAFITEIEFEKKLDTDGLPLIKIKAARKDTGKLYDGDVFVSNEATLDCSEEELQEKIRRGEIGLGTCFLARSAISGHAIFGRNCIIGEDAKVFGGVFGDNVVLGRNVWVGPEVEIATGVMIGRDTSLSGKIKIGFYPDNETGVDPSFVMIGNSCALEDCVIHRRTIIGKHCMVENNPEFSGVIPDGATVVAQGKSFDIVPF